MFVGNGVEMSASLDSRKFITADFFDKQAITTFKKIESLGLQQIHNKSKCVMLNGFKVSQ